MVVLSMSSPAFSMRAISAGSTKKKSFPSTYEVRAGSSRPERAPRRKRRTSPGRISRDVWLTGARNLDPYSTNSSPRTSCSGRRARARHHHTRIVLTRRRSRTRLAIHSRDANHQRLDSLDSARHRASLNVRRCAKLLGPN